jgi:hypothetical protein
MSDDRFFMPYEEVPDPTPIDHDESEWPISDHVSVLGGTVSLPTGAVFGMLRFGFGFDPMDHSVAATTFVTDETALRQLRTVLVQAVDGALDALAKAKRG